MAKPANTFNMARSLLLDEVRDRLHRFNDKEWKRIVDAVEASSKSLEKREDK